VLINAQVSRLLTKANEIGPPNFQAVEFRSKTGNHLHKVQAKKEIILSAGSVGTPHILMNSGVGDSQTLQRFGIQSILHNPSVGRNLSDHPLTVNEWTVNSTDTFEKFTRDPVAFEADLELWKSNRTGVFAGGITNNVGWIRFPFNSTILNNRTDPAAGPHTAHFEFLISVGQLHAFTFSSAQYAMILEWNNTSPLSSY